MYSTASELNRTHIDVQDAAQMRFWCGKLGCGDLKLKEAVRAVGHAPYHVERYLRQSRASRGFDRRH
jgi:hypothetical protein